MRRCIATTENGRCEHEAMFYVEKHSDLSHRKAEYCNHHADPYRSYPADFLVTEMQRNLSEVHHMKKQQICYGQDVWVWTFAGWEKWDWNSPAFETDDDAFEALSDYSKITTTEPS